MQQISCYIVSSFCKNRPSVVIRRQLSKINIRRSRRTSLSKRKQLSRHYTSFRLQTVTHYSSNQPARRSTVQRVICYMLYVITYYMLYVICYMYNIAVPLWICYVTFTSYESRVGSGSRSSFVVWRIAALRCSAIAHRVFNHVSLRVNFVRPTTIS